MIALVSRNGDRTAPQTRSVVPRRGQSETVGLPVGRVEAERRMAQRRSSSTPHTIGAIATSTRTSVKGRPVVWKTDCSGGSQMMAAAKTISNAMPHSSRWLVKTPIWRSEARARACREAGADLAGDDAREGHGRRQDVGVVERGAPRPSASPGDQPPRSSTQKNPPVTSAASTSAEDHHARTSIARSMMPFARAGAAGGP